MFRLRTHTHTESMAYYVRALQCAYIYKSLFFAIISSMNFYLHTVRICISYVYSNMVIVYYIINVMQYYIDNTYLKCGIIILMAII